jgi:outer membrane lipoprotein carrier protein
VTPTSRRWSCARSTTAGQVPSAAARGEIAAVEKQFEIRTAAAPAGKERFDLVPREAGGLFAALAVQFRAGVLEQLVIADGLGQRTEVEFSDVQPAGAIDDLTFRFETPPGVDELHDE